MATTRTAQCASCGRKITSSTRLFDLLLKLSKGACPACDDCGGPVEVELGFPFGLNVGFTRCPIVDCFSPTTPQGWKDEDQHPVEFFPFLVILKRNGGEPAVWLPYWHVVHKPGGRATKYGQWAPFMDAHLMQDLLAQARAKGHDL